MRRLTMKVFIQSKDFTHICNTYHDFSCLSIVNNKKGSENECWIRVESVTEEKQQPFALSSMCVSSNRGDTIGPDQIVGIEYSSVEWISKELAPCI